MHIVEPTKSELEGSLLVNVSIAPPERLLPQFVNLSAAIGLYGAAFTLGNINRRPHLTVYMARLHARNVDKLAAAISGLRQDLGPISIRHTGYETTAGGYIEVSYERNCSLLGLQRTVADVAQSLRFQVSTGLIKESYYGPFDQQQRENASTTGYDLMDALYRPHVTLNRFATEPKALLRLPILPDIGKFSFKSAVLQIAVADDNGSVVEVRRRIALD